MSKKTQETALLAELLQNKEVYSDWFRNKDAKYIKDGMERIQIEEVMKDV